MADDVTHKRNRRMTTMAVIGFVVLVIGFATENGVTQALGVGAFAVALLGRYWT